MKTLCLVYQLDRDVSMHTGVTEKQREPANIETETVTFKKFVASSGITVHVM